MNGSKNKRELYRFTFDGRNIVLDVITGNVFTVDDMTADVLEAIETGPDTDIPGRLASRYGREEVESVIEEIKAAGLMEAATGDEPPEDEYERPEISDLALFVTDRCNLRCTYCYVTGVENDRQLKNMDLRTAERAMDFFLENSGQRKNGKVLFFGGEPLLNLPLIKHVVEYARPRWEAAGKSLIFTLDTNGVLLTPPTIDYINGNDIVTAISLDGPKEVNDRARVFADGRGSYDNVVDRAREFIASREGDVWGRATLTSDNIRFMDNVRHLMEIGFKRVVVDSDSGVGGEWTESQKQTLKEEFDQAARYYMEKLRAGQYFFLGNLTTIMESIGRNIKRRYHCGAAREFIAVATDGTIYPCQRLAGMPEFAMGDVFDGMDDTWRRRITGRPVESREPCSRCWARYLCGGGCYYRSYQATGDVFRPDRSWCDLTRHVLRLAMGCYACALEEEKKIAEKA